MFGRNKQDERKNFKKGIDAEEARRKREDAAVGIRKKNRELEMDQKRRQMMPVSTLSSAISETAVGNQVLPQFVAAVMGSDANQWLEGATNFRKLLSIQRNPPIKQVIDSGILPRLVQFLHMNNNPKLQFESAWALTNIASGTSEETRELLNHGAVAAFVTLLSSQDDELREQAVWALGNIAGDSTTCRDYVLQAGTLQPLLAILSNPSKISMQRNATWTLSNLCRGKPVPNFSWVSSAIPVLARLLHSSDQDVVIDATWAFSYLSDGTDSQIQAVLQSGIAPRLVELLSCANSTMQTPALRTIGNIVTGNDQQTQQMLDLRILPALFTLLHNPKKTLRKEACWTVSNITAGNKAQAQMVLDSNIIPPLVTILSTGEFEVKKEAAWAISNATTWRVPNQIQILVQSGCIKPLCELLKASDTKVIGVAMEALENILSVGAKIGQQKNGEVNNPYAIAVEEAEGLDRLEELQSHENHVVYEQAVRILENYFGAEEEDQNIAPNVAVNAHVFNFGTNFQQPSTFSF